MSSCGSPDPDLSAREERDADRAAQCHGPSARTHTTRPPRAASRFHPLRLTGSVPYKDPARAEETPRQGGARLEGTEFVP